MIVAWAGIRGTGQSFLDWSLYYLTGRDKFWNMKFGWQDLLTDPTTGRNAHLHLKNHPKGSYDLLEFLDKAKELDSDQLITVHPFSSHETGLGEFTAVIQTCLENDVRLIMMRQTKPYPYFASERNEITDEEELETLRQRIGYAKANRKTIRDQMSFRLINNSNDFIDNVNYFHTRFDSKLDYVMTDQQWANDTEKVMLEVIDSLKLEIKKDRLESWRVIRNKWRQNYGRLIDWYEKDLTKVVDAILQGKDLDLDPYGITLAKEIVIMAHLLNNHKKRLWLPDNNFPKNTKILNGFLK
tara:strand:- start:1130 stop:2023 length:894 start_codon:yes stop_codon:yes gene_type:complete